MFDLHNDPYDPDYWIWEFNCETGKIKVPKIPETCTTLTTNYSNATLNYQGECEPQTITGEQLGAIINISELRDVDAKDPDPCDILVFNPGCSDTDCSPEVMQWKKYHIPDAGDCIVEPDEDGYYKVLVKTDCGCIKECRIPVVPDGLTTINYIRDSVPDDPDFPWYYGKYNDRIKLHLAENAPQYFGKYALKVTINYGVQVIKSSTVPNINFRSLLVPVVDGSTTIDIEKESSILQGNATFSPSNPEIPWGTQSLRGSFTFIVPKGKEAYLHHEFRARTQSSYPGWVPDNALDGQRIPDNEVITPNILRYFGSRLNALQAIVEPTNGVSNMNPVVDPERDQLDPADDEYPA